MQEQHEEFSISSLCRTLEVSRSGYYEWRSRPPRAQTDADQQVQDKVQRYFVQGRGTYGTRRLKHLLAQDGLQVSRRRIGRLLAQAGLRCKTQRKCKAPKTKARPYGSPRPPPCRTRKHGIIVSRSRSISPWPSPSGAPQADRSSVGKPRRRKARCEKNVALRFRGSIQNTCQNRS